MLQGIIYSDTAVANYPDPSIMLGAITVIPAKRLGTVEEVLS